MTVRFTIEFTHGSQFITDADRYRAEDAIEAVLEREGITTDEQLKASLLAFIARTECEPCDETLADKYERIQSAGDIALTKGWRDPNGAGLSLGVIL